MPAVPPGTKTSVRSWVPHSDDSPTVDDPTGGGIIAEVGEGSEPTGDLADGSGRTLLLAATAGSVSATEPRLSTHSDTSARNEARKGATATEDTSGDSPASESCGEKPGTEGRPGSPLDRALQGRLPSGPEVSPRLLPEHPSSERPCAAIVESTTGH